jgi:hypothetical protein
MKTNVYNVLIPQTGAESDALAIFLSTVQQQCAPWVYQSITAMGGNGQRVLLCSFSPAAYKALANMYADLDVAGEPTIGDGLHWQDGESIMRHLTPMEV